MSHLSQSAPSEPVVAVCDDLTEEARRVLADAKVLIVALKSFGWTEQSYENIRVQIGSRVKRPKG